MGAFLVSTTIQPEDVCFDIKRVATELGYPPTKWEYEDDGEFSTQDVRHHFDSWGAALKAAGVDLDDERRWQLGLTGGDA